MDSKDVIYEVNDVDPRYTDFLVTAHKRGGYPTEDGETVEIEGYDISSPMEFILTYSYHITSKRVKNMVEDEEVREYIEDEYCYDWDSEDVYDEMDERDFPSLGYYLFVHSRDREKFYEPIDEHREDFPLNSDILNNSLLKVSKLFVYFGELYQKEHLLDDLQDKVSEEKLSEIDENLFDYHPEIS